MTATTLAVAAGASALAALTLFVLGTRIAMRRVSADALWANRAFASWWIGVASVLVVTSAQAGLGAFGVADPRPFTFLLVMQAAGVSVAFAALTAYVLHTARGPGAWLRGLGVYYGLFFVLALARSIFEPPTSVDVTAWSASVATAQGGFARDVLITMVYAPPLAAVIFLGTLYPRLPTATQRWRVALLTVGVGSWLVVAAGTAFTSQGFVWMLARAVMPLVVAAAGHYAYAPPAFVVRRFADDPVRAY